MSAKHGKTRRRLSAGEKVKILEEGRAPGTTVAEVLRRHQRDAATFYRWERQAKAGMLEALGDTPRTSDAAARENARLRAALDQKERIIAEVVEENLARKKGL
ncbi:MAG: transposase [Gemmatimonadaceae bacterium]